MSGSSERTKVSGRDDVGLEGDGVGDVGGPRLDSKLAPVSSAERQRAGPAHDLDAVERRQLLEQRPAVGDPTHGIAESPRELDRDEGDAC